MGGKVMRWFLSLTGYLLYTLVVLVCLLWLLFPAEAVKGWLEQQLDKHYSPYSWKIGAVDLALPGGFVMTDVRMISSGSTKPLLTLDRLAIAPDSAHIFSKNKALKYTFHLLQGVVRGQVLLSSGSEKFTCRGTLDGLQLTRMNFLQESLGRAFDGTVAGTFSGHGTLNVLRQAKWKGNLRITEGTLQFKKPVLGLDELPYTKIEAGFSFKDGNWMLEQGKLQSVGMSGIFSGSVQAENIFASSRLQFKGTLTPRSEMFAGLKNKQMVEVVRTHLKNGGLPFTVSGTAGEPGILFGGELSRALMNLKGSTE